MANVKLYVLGPPRLERDGQPVALQLRRAIALLAYLAMNSRPEGRETLAALLWPESEEEQARARLRRTLHRLGTAIGASNLTVDGSAVGLSPDANLWVDALQFEQWSSDGLGSFDGPGSDRLTQLRLAAALYSDDFMSGFTLPDSVDWEEWQFHHRDRLRLRFALVLERITRECEQLAEWENAIDAARRWLALDQLHEPAHRTLMPLYVQAGQHASAIRQYQTCQHILRIELGVEPDEATTELFENIKLRRIAPSASRTVQAVRSSQQPRPKVHLPPQATSFIGRKREIAALRQLPRDEPSCRLVSLVGPGGIGKTRLAIEAAESVQSDFHDGVFFVPVAPLSVPDQVVSAIAENVGLQFYGATPPKQQVLDYLKEKEMLLVLDSFEHLLDAAVLLNEIVLEAPRVQVWVTSRERLSLSGETVFSVGSLDVPDSDSPRVAFESEAIQLLMQRARLARPDLEIRDYSLQAMVDICRLVQGMPLAIELAAGWIEALSFQEIATEIGRSLDFLEAQTRDLPPRQNSIRVTFESSWARLPEPERQTFMRLCVFRGSFDRHAAEAVARADPRALRALVNRSFLAVRADDRYEIHELLRQFGAEVMEASSEADHLRDLHASFYLRKLHAVEADVKGQRQLEALAEIESRLPNVRAAWQWALQRNDVEAASRALESLYIFFAMRNRHQEGAQLLRLAREIGDESLHGKGALFRAHLLAALALLESFSNPGSPDTDRDLMESLSIALESGDRNKIAFCQLMSGCRQFIVQRDFVGALTLFEQSLENFRDLDDQFYVAIALNWIGLCHGSLTNLDNFKNYTGQALEIARDNGNKFIEALASGHLAIAALGSGEYAAAESYCLEAIETHRAMNVRVGIAEATTRLGIVSLLRGDLECAFSHGSEGLETARDVNISQALAEALAFLALHSAITEDYEAGRRMAEASLAYPATYFEAILANWALAIASCGLGDHENARRHVQEVVTSARSRSYPAMMLWPLPVASIIDASEGKFERAAELNGFVSHHPLSATGWMDRWARLSALRTELKSKLGPEAFQEAWDRGKNRDLDWVVSEYVTMLASSHADNER